VQPPYVTPSQLKIGHGPAVGAVPTLPPAAMGLPDDQKEVVMRVLALTPAQINALPPAERDAFIQIRRQLLGSNA